MCAVCPAEIIVVVVVVTSVLLFAAVPSRGLDLYRCSGVGPSRDQPSSVECSSILLPENMDLGPKLVQARFVFALGDELPSVDVGGRRRFRLRLLSVEMGLPPPGTRVADATPAPAETPGLAVFVGGINHLEVSFCTEKCPSKTSSSYPNVTALLTTSPVCNITTWDPDCDLAVRLDPADTQQELDMGGSISPDLIEGVADLEIHGTVVTLVISGGADAADVDKILGALDLASLTSASLSYVRVDDCSFHGLEMPALTHLNISHSKPPADNCSFMNISAEKLTSLILHNFSLSSVPRHLSKLRYLEVLDLSMNQDMVSNDTASFKEEITTWKNLTNVRSLSLSQVKLGSLSVLRDLISEPNGTACTPFSNISKLKLSGCEIPNLEDENFYNCLGSLKELDLSHNVISTLKTRIFYQLKSLKVLLLSHNVISILPEIELNNSTALDFFDLSHNRIRYLSNFLRSGVTEVFDISYNKIVEWSREEMFCRTGLFNTWVDNLNLSFNSLKTITRIMGDSLLVLGSVDIRGNKFDCSNCNTIELQKWLQKTRFSFEKLKVVQTETFGVVCAGPKSLAGHTVIDLVLDPVNCTVPTGAQQSYVVAVVVPLVSFLFVVVAVGSTLAYRYRFELAYIRYYWSIKKRRSNADGTENEEYDFDAFVSYSRHDRAWVLDELMNSLEDGQEKYKLCLHERDFRLGSLILENIESSMRKSRYTLVILSRGFVDSQVTHQWCRWELEMANYKLFGERREFLILLQLEPLERRDMPRHLKYLIETRTYLEWPGRETAGQRADFWRRLRKALGRSLHQRRQGSPGVEAGDTKDNNTTTTTMTTTTTIITATTTTTVVTTTANTNKKNLYNHGDHQALNIANTTTTSSSKNKYCNNNCNKKRNMKMIMLPVARRLLSGNSAVALPRAKLVGESEA